MSVIATSHRAPAVTGTVRKRVLGRWSLSTLVIVWSWLIAIVHAATLTPIVTVVSDHASTIVTNTVTISVHIGSDLVGAPVPTGTVDIVVTPSGNVIHGLALDATGSVAARIGGFTAGDNIVGVFYSGDATYLPVNGNVTISASFQPTAVVVGSDADPSALGQAVTFTFSTTANGSQVSDSATGSMSITDQTTGIAYGPTRKNGSIQVAFASEGPHQLLFSFSGTTTGGLAPSSTTITQTVLPANAATMTALSASVTQIHLGQQVTLSATIGASSGPLATGVIAFFDNGAPVASAPIDDGAATTVLTPTTIATHQFTARYQGQDGLASSVSSPIAVSVSVIPSIITVAASPNPALLGQPITLAITLRDDLGAPLAGLVIFREGPTTLGSTTIVGGTGTGIVPGTLSAGSHEVLVDFDGDQTIAASQTSVTLVIGDVEPPRIVVAVRRPMLLRDDHRLVDVGLQLDARDNVRVIDITISVTQNEPVHAGPGDRSPDAVVRTDAGGHILGLQLRAEHAARGHGRVYLITTTAYDTSGNHCAASTAVVVPRSDRLVDLFDVIGEALVAVMAGTSLPYDSLVPTTSG